MKVAGLFAGIGGLEAGLDDAGHRTVFLCEIDDAAREVLKVRFPDVPTIAKDIRDIKKLPAGVDLVAAGFPCQDISQAGMTLGMNGTQSVLVNQVFRLLKKDIPHVLLENVSFMLHLHKGQVIRHIVGELERLGFSWAYRVIDTRSFGLPQRRQRVFILASRKFDPWRKLFSQDCPKEEDREFRGKACGFYWTEGLRGLGWAVDSIPTLKGGSTVGIPSSPAIWMPDGNIVTPEIRDAERLQGFEADWTKPAEKVKRPSYRWKLLGNAVGVPVSKWLGKMLEARSEWDPPKDSQRFEDEGPCPSAAFGSRHTGRFRADVSAFPVRYTRVPLSEFLRYEPKPLSAKATEGFINRLVRGTLRYPEEFKRALNDHLLRQGGLVSEPLVQ